MLIIFSSIVFLLLTYSDFIFLLFIFFVVFCLGTGSYQEAMLPLMHMNLVYTNPAAPEK